jgi:uncharacterized membrane protein YqiK
MNQQEVPNRLLPAIVAMAIVVALLWFFLAALPMITPGSHGAL